MDNNLLATLDLANFNFDALATAQLEFAKAAVEANAPRQRAGSSERLSVTGGVSKAKGKRGGITRTDVRKTRSYEKLPAREEHGGSQQHLAPSPSPRPRASTGQTMLKNFFQPTPKSPRDSVPHAHQHAHQHQLHQQQQQQQQQHSQSYKKTGMFSSFRLPRSASMPNLADQDASAQLAMLCDSKSSNSPNSQSQFSSTYSLEVPYDPRFAILQLQ
eukprot:Opistho-2@35859